MRPVRAGSSGRALKLNKPGDAKGAACSQSAGDHHADRAADRVDARHQAFEIPEDKETAEGDEGGDLQPREPIRHKEIGAKKHKTAYDIGAPDVESAFTCPLWIGFVETQLVFHHKIDPFVFVFRHFLHGL